MLTRKTKAASLAMVAVAAFAIAAPQARAELPDGYEQLLYIETYEGGGQSIATGIRPDLAHKIETGVAGYKSLTEVSSNVTRTGKGYIDYAKGLSKAVKT